MTNRTMSLLVLFVASLMICAAVLAAAVPLAARADLSVPWLPAVLAAVTAIALFYGGRIYLLPASVAASRVRSLATLTVVVCVTLAGAVALVWSVQTLAGRDLPVPVPTMIAWFLGLRAAVAMVHGRAAPG